MLESSEGVQSAVQHSAAPHGAAQHSLQSNGVPQADGMAWCFGRAAVHATA